MRKFKTDNNEKLQEVFQEPKTVDEFLSNAFNYILVNGEYPGDKPKPTHKTRKEVFEIMSNKDSFIEVYDILYDESQYQGFSESEILKGLPYKG